MKLIAVILFAIIFFIALVFSVLNFHLVQINLGFISFSLPLAVALTIELFAGIAIGLLAALIHINLKSDYAQLSKQLRKSNKEK